MNIVTIYGGPRVDGNTATVLGWVEDALREKRRTVKRFNANTLDIRGCQGCYACTQSTDAPGCVVQDDMQQVVSAMADAEAIVYASPLYMWGVAGQLKAVYDRGMCLVKDFMGPNHRSFVEGAKATLLMTCMGPVENNSEWARDQFLRYAGYAKLDVIDPWIVAGCSSPDQLSGDVRAKAAELAAKLID